MVESNYEGKQIPFGVGVAIPFALLLWAPWSVVEGVEKIYAFQVATISLIAYVGWRDDRFGEKETKGIRGHFVLWWKTGKRSTGFWKATVGVLLAAFVGALYSRSWWEGVLHMFIIVLLTNQINLFDLRPGRALKCFFAYAAIVLTPSIATIPLSVWLPLLVTTVFLFLKDIRGEAMLGDTGSNALGFALALWIVWYGSLGLKLVVASASLLIQLYAEKKSISALIQRSPVLLWLDMLGRRETEKP